MFSRCLRKIIDCIQLLADYKDHIEFGDKTNREGHAAKVYFNELFWKEICSPYSTGN